MLESTRLAVTIVNVMEKDHTMLFRFNSFQNHNMHHEVLKLKCLFSILLPDLLWGEQGCRLISCVSETDCMRGKPKQNRLKENVKSYPPPPPAYDGTSEWKPRPPLQPTRSMEKESHVSRSKSSAHAFLTVVRTNMFYLLNYKLNALPFFIFFCFL